MTHAPTRPMPYRVDVYHLGKSYFVEDGAGWIDGDPNEVREFPFREQAIRFARKPVASPMRRAWRHGQTSFVGSLAWSVRTCSR